MLLQDIETCRQARLVLRELIKDDKSRAQLWGSLVMLIGAIALLISHDMREIILPILGK